MKSLFLLAIVASHIFISTSKASANNGELSGFRYQTCESRTCVVVSAPKAWLSQTGAFVASGADNQTKGAAKLQIIKAGKTTNEFYGDEVVSQPEIGTMTVESDGAVVMVDVQKATVEVISKTARGSK